MLEPNETSTCKPVPQRNALKSEDDVDPPSTPNALAAPPPPPSYADKTGLLKSHVRLFHALSSPPRTLCILFPPPTNKGSVGVGGVELQVPGAPPRARRHHVSRVWTCECGRAHRQYRIIGLRVCLLRSYVALMIFWIQYIFFTAFRYLKK